MTHTASTVITWGVTSRDPNLPKYLFLFFLSIIPKHNTESKFRQFLNVSKSDSGVSNSGHRDTCSAAHWSILTDFLISLCMTKATLLVLLLDERPTLKAGEKWTAYKEQKRKWNRVICSWKGERRDPESSVRPSTISLSQPKAAQPGPAPLSSPPAVHSCGLPSASTICSQSEQGADPAEN